MKQNVNYIEHHRAVNYRLSEDTLTSIHVSLYNALFLIWNESGFDTELSINRNDVMKLSKIGSANTYTKALKELDERGYLTYKPSHNPLIGSRINLYRFDKSSDKTTNKSTDKTSDKTSDNSTDKTSDTLTKHLNLETTKLLNNETKETKFDFKKNLIDFGFQKDLVDEWMKRRKELRKSNTERTFKDFIDEVKKTDKPPNEIMELILKKGWGSFEYEFYLNIQKNGTGTKNNQTTFNRSSKDVSTDFSKPNGGF